MANRAALIVLLAALGLSLAGCGPCGFFATPLGLPDACRAEPAPQR
jgi:predicted small lipoprotein YifL